MAKGGKRGKYEISADSLKEESGLPLTTGKKWEENRFG